MFKLVNNPKDIAQFAPDLIPELTRCVDEIVLPEIMSGNAYKSDEVTMWVSQVTAPLFASGRPRNNDMVVPYLRALVSEAEAIVLGEKFLEVATEKFGAGK